MAEPDAAPRTPRKDAAARRQQVTRGSRRAGVGAKLREQAREAEGEAIYAGDLPERPERPDCTQCVTAGTDQPAHEWCADCHSDWAYADDLPLAYLSLGPDGLKITFADPEREAPDER